LLKEIAPKKLQQYKKIAPPPPPQGLMGYVGGGGGGDSNGSDLGIAGSPHLSRVPDGTGDRPGNSNMPPGYFTGYDVTWNSGGDWSNGNEGGMADTYGTAGYGGEQYGDSPMGTY
jgi:hypothetical protein